MGEEEFFFEGSVVSVLTTEPIDKLLDYLVPLSGVSNGEFVEVSLGSRTVEGLVWGPGVSSLDRKKLKILRILNERYKIDPGTKIFLTRMADYNLASLNSIFRLTGWRKFLKTSTKVPYIYQLSSRVTENEIVRVSEKRRRVINLLSSKNFGERLETLKQITAASKVSLSVIKGLEKEGFIEKVAVKRKYEKLDSKLNYLQKLSSQQQVASDKIKQIVDSTEFSVTLLHGVTGSGKTEVLLSVAAKFISKQQQVLILVPEIVLASGLVSRIERSLGIAPVEWNSGVTNAKKKEIFHSLISNDGSIQIVVGARSALFLPFKSLGLIIIDEEHDISFKQQEGIRFNARDMGVLKAQSENAHIILSSATPSLETILNFKIGKYKRVDLRERFREGSKILTKVIDMKKEDIGRENSLSPQLISIARNHLNKGEQILLFLNRRGYAPLVVCKKCGVQLSCKYCDSKLVEHRNLNRRVCHQCGHEFPIDNICSSCGSVDEFNLLGFGVERLMEECQETFPGKKVMIVSSDIMNSKHSFVNGISKIEKGEIDIVIGTQIIAKGHNFPFLSLVAVIDGDLGLYGGDLRGAEKTFQIIQQVSGRVGRFGKEGTVAIQSWRPENEIIVSILKGNDEEFWERELTNRQEANVPPFIKFIAIILEGKKKAELFNVGHNISRELKKFTKSGLDVFGPALAPISRIRGRVRVRLLIQCPKNLSILNVFKEVLKSPKNLRGYKIIVDVDPQNFL